MLGRHALNGVGFVDHQKIVGVKISGPVFGQFLPPPEEDEEEAVVEHHDVGGVDPSTRLLIETGHTIAPPAAALGTDPRLAANEIPHRGVGQGIKVGEGSITRPATPIENTLKLHRFRAGKQLRPIF